MTHRAEALSAVIALTALSCSPPASTTGQNPDTSERKGQLRAIVPGPAAGLFAPAQTRTSDLGKTGAARDQTASAPEPAGDSAGGSIVNGAHLSDLDACGSCHPDAFAQQQVSAHAFSSFNNPVYRYAVDRLRAGVGKPASQMCAGCHDIALLIDRVMVGEVAPTDARAHAGVTCRVCHGIVAASNDGNGSYVLSRVPIAIPEGTDPAAIDRHKRSARPIDGTLLCGSCHRSFLSTATGNGHFLAGQDEITGWQTSAYNQSGVGRVDDPLPRTTCIDCHMRPEPAPLGDVAADERGEIRSHRFLGGHTWLASMLGDDTQLARQTEFLRGSVSLDIGAAFTGKPPAKPGGKPGDQAETRTWTRPADGAPVTPGAPFGIDVVMRNLRVGHRFPGGVRDAADSWLDVRVYDARGTLIAQSGDTHGDDAHRLRALVGNRAGLPQWQRNTEDFYEPIVDHTLAARAAQVVRFALPVPATLDPASLPWRVSARLLHRTRNLQVQKLACEATKSQRGRAFARYTDELGQPVLDPCKPQPVTVIASAETWVGTGAEQRLARAGRALAWKRLYQHGLGLVGEMPREATVARDSLLAALEAVDVSGNPRDRAKILGAMASVYAGAPCGPSAPPGWPTCQGRYEEALRWLQRAEQIVPGHPALQMTRAAMLDRSFRWPQAAEALAVAVRAVPENLFAWRQYAGVLHSLGKPAEALLAARRGLALDPREDDLLRAQHLSLKALGAPAAEVQSAADAYQSHRRAARPTEMQALCAEQLPMCERERFTVHTHTLRPPP